MDNKKQRKQDKNVSRITPEGLAAIIASFIALIGVVYGGIIQWRIQKSKEDHEIKMWEKENTQEQTFDSKCEIIEKSGIEYLQYTVTSDPCVGGYHVIPYPYLVYETEEEKVYIPIMGQFTQEEYAADEDGHCIMLRENTGKELQELAEKMTDYPVKIECLAAVQYVEEGQEKKKTYEIRDGRLTEPKLDMVVEVLSTWRDENSAKIDMLGWPCIDQDGLKDIL